MDGLEERIPERFDDPPWIHPGHGQDSTTARETTRERGRAHDRAGLETRLERTRGSLRFACTRPGSAQQRTGVECVTVAVGYGHPVDTALTTTHTRRAP
jgi:hypothetical protein